MDTIEKEAAPPYSPLPSNPPETQLKFTRCIDRKTERCKSQTSPAQLRNFLRHVLRTDYQMPLDVTPGGHYFGNLASIMNDMKTRSDTKINWGAEEVLDFTKYHWVEIHQPSRDLSLPTNMILELLNRFCRYRDQSGVYRGCTFDVLYYEGTEALAAKLWVDRRLLLPVLFDRHEHADLELQTHLEYRMKRVQSKYFVVCSGPYWFYRRSSMNLFELRHLIPRMTISLTPDGEEYNARRARYLERGASKESKGQGLPWYRKVLGRLCNTQSCGDEVEAKDFERIERKRFDEVLAVRD